MYKRIAFVRITIMVLLAISIALTGCGSQQSAIVGTWERVTPADQVPISFWGMEQIEFLSDGTFVLPEFNNLSGKYSFPESDRIRLETTEVSFTYKFTLSGDRLVFDDGETTVEYKRIK